MTYKIKLQITKAALGLRRLICHVFGHAYYQGKITLALSIANDGKTWKKVSQTSEIVICRRCLHTPVIGAAIVGSEDAHIKFSPTYSIANIRLYLGDEIENKVFKGLGK